MSSDNFNFIAASGNVYTNLSASRYWETFPLTEDRLKEDGYSPTMSIEEYRNLSAEELDFTGRFYAEYGDWTEEGQVIPNE